MECHRWSIKAVGSSYARQPLPGKYTTICFFPPRINSPSPVFECTLSLKLLSISKRTHSACEVPLVQNNKAVHHGKKLWNTTLSPPSFNAHARTHMRMYARTYEHTWYPSFLCNYFPWYAFAPSASALKNKLLFNNSPFFFFFKTYTFFLHCIEFYIGIQEKILLRESCVAFIIILNLGKPLCCTPKQIKSSSVAMIILLRHRDGDQ